MGHQLKTEGPRTVRSCWVLVSCCFGYVHDALDIFFENSFAVFGNCLLLNLDELGFAFNYEVALQEHFFFAEEALGRGLLVQEAANARLLVVAGGARVDQQAVLQEALWLGSLWLHLSNLFSKPEIR